MPAALRMIVRLGLILPVLFAVGPAQAAGIQLRDRQYSLHMNAKVIELTGPIVPGDAQRLADFVGANFDCGDDGIDCSPYTAIVSLDSPGGDYAEGQKIAALLRSKALASIVERGRSCLSACAIAYLGGSGFWPTGGVGSFIARFIEPGARIGFHSPYLPQADAQEIAKSNLPLVLETSRLDNEQLADVLNGYYVDASLTGRILSKGPDQTYDIATIEDMLLFRVNFPYFPAALVRGTVEEKTRNVCLKLLALRNARPIKQYEGDYLDAKFVRSENKTPDGRSVFGFAVLDRPRNIDYCGIAGEDDVDPFAAGGIALLRLGDSADGGNTEEPFYWFNNRQQGWSSAGYDNQDATRAILALDTPLNYWLYDRQATIAGAAEDFSAYLEIQKQPLSAAWQDLQTAHLESQQPSASFDNKRLYTLDKLRVDQSLWPREMYDYLLREALAPRSGFKVTYSQKYKDAFVVTGPDAANQSDVYVLGLRSADGAALVRLTGPWPEGSAQSSEAARKTITAIACSTRFGEARLPCNR